MATLTIPASSTQFVYIPVTSSGDLTLDTVEIAFLSDLRANPVEADWMPATWAHGQNASILVGPDAGAITFTAGTTYNAWVRVSADPEKPTMNAGPISVV